MGQAQILKILDHPKKHSGKQAYKSKQAQIYKNYEYWLCLILPIPFLAELKYVL